MKKMRKMFCMMTIIGISVFTIMMFMMLFIDFRKIEIAIPFIIGCIGHIGTGIIEHEMKKRSSRIRVRRMNRRAY